MSSEIVYVRTGADNQLYKSFSVIIVSSDAEVNYCKAALNAKKFTLYPLMFHKSL